MATATSEHGAPPAPAPAVPRPWPAFLAALVLRLAGAGMLVWVAAVHLHLWQEGYRDIHIIGPLFLADAVGGFALAAVLLVWPRPVVGLMGAGYMLSTLAGLVYSINFTLFGFKESSGASFVPESIILESVSALVLLVWSAAVRQSLFRSRFSRIS